MKNIGNYILIDQEVNENHGNVTFFLVHKDSYNDGYFQNEDITERVIELEVQEGGDEVYNYDGGFIDHIETYDIHTSDDGYDFDLGVRVALNELKQSL